MIDLTIVDNNEIKERVTEAVSYLLRKSVNIKYIEELNAILDKETGVYYCCENGEQMKIGGFYIR